jgi:hypothetical protein
MRSVMHATLLSTYIPKNQKLRFKKLYFLRWPVEVKYDIVKNKLQLENFNTRTVEGIQQDFYAAMYLTNIAAAAQKDVQEDIENARKDKGNKYRYKANLNEIIGVLKDRFVFALAQDSQDEQKAMIDLIIQEIKRHVVPIRPNRSVPRNSSARKVNKVSHASLMAAASQEKRLVDDYLVKEVIMSELEV